MHNAKIKTLKSNFVILFLICFCTLFLLQCKKRDKSECVGTYSLTDQEKQIIPYHINDTFVLIDSLGLDSIKFYVDTIKDYYDRWYTEDPYQGMQSDIVYKDYYSIEEYVVYASSYFSVTMRFIDPLNPPVKKSISFELNITSHPEINYFYGACYFNGILFYQENITPENYKLFAIMHDSLSLNNKKFYSVYELSQSIPPNDTTISIAKLYYSIGSGLVGIKTNNGNTWNLK